MTGAALPKMRLCKKMAFSTKFYPKLTRTVHFESDSSRRALAMRGITSNEHCYAKINT
jgi:hypothetical protein